MKKRIVFLLSTLLVLILSLSACSDEDLGCVEAGGLTICAGENTTLISGESGVWEVPGKYRFECLGAFYNDVDLDQIEDLKDPAGLVIFSPKDDFIVAFKVSNLGYTLTDADREKGTIQLSSLYSTNRINDGEKIEYRPYPWEEDDYQYDEVNLDYEIPAVEKGQSSEVFYDEFVTNYPLDREKDVFVFTTFFNDGENVYNGVFEIKLTSLQKYLEENGLSIQ